MLAPEQVAIIPSALFWINCSKLETGRGRARTLMLGKMLAQMRVQLRVIITRSARFWINSSRVAVGRRMVRGGARM
jgi:hypothetical protein